MSRTATMLLVNCPNCGIQHETEENCYCLDCSVRFRRHGLNDFINKDGKLGSTAEQALDDLCRSQGR